MVEMFKVLFFKKKNVVYKKLMFFLLYNINATWIDFWGAVNKKANLVFALHQAAQHCKECEQCSLINWNIHVSNGNHSV